jgi:hypothetical protein
MRINMVWLNYTFTPRVSTPVCNLPNHGFGAWPIHGLVAKNGKRELASR